MKILHYVAQQEPELTAKYVHTLCDAMGTDAECIVTNSLSDAIGQLNAKHYDLLHLHGCWNYTAYRVVRHALRKGCRLVVTPHGQLEPWVIEQNYWKEKLPKRILYVKRMIQQAYAVIIQGKMEEECMQKLGWNNRTVIIRNSLITQTITPQAMAKQVSQVYRKIMDSNTLELMTDDTKTTLRQLLKVGITGDERWLEDSCVRITDHSQWRMLYCHVHHEQVAEVVKRGLRILRMDAPDFDIQTMPCFMPDGYEPSQTIEQAIGMQFATENDRLLATFRHLRRQVLRKRLTLAHLVELDKELRNHDCAEDQLCDALEERHLKKFAGRLMQLMNDLTGLNEGMMPMPPVNDRLTRIMRRQIDNHLRI